MTNIERKSKIFEINWVKYKMVRVIEATEKDIHHIISKKKINQFNVNNEKNKIKIPRRQHVALNQLYKDHQTPKEQLRDMVEIWKSALSEEVRQVLYDLLSLDDEAFYDFDLVKKHRLLKKNIG